RLEDVREDGACLLALGAGRAIAQDGLGDLEVPIAEVVPEEAVGLVRRLVDAEGPVAVVADCNRLPELRDDPLVEEAHRRERRAGPTREERLRLDSLELTEDEPACVPHLVREVAVT